MDILKCMKKELEFQLRISCLPCIYALPTKLYLCFPDTSVDRAQAREAGGFKPELGRSFFVHFKMT